MMQSLLRNARAWVDESFLESQKRLAWHPELKDSARHALLGAGKALRPALLFWVYNHLRAAQHDKRPPQFVLDWGLALEMIHTYSLIHDDLPAMDDDSLRRGRPTLHVLKNEAAAILAGDALLTGAFEVLSKSTAQAFMLVRALQELSFAAGGAAMVGGQVRDMLENQDISLEDLNRRHREKTGALIAAALVLASIAEDNQGLQSPRHEIIRDWGLDVGLLFQISDDLLDVKANTQELGKSAGKDARSEKTTYVSLLGFEGAQKAAEELKKSLEERASSWISKNAAAEMLNFLLIRKQ